MASKKHHKQDATRPTKARVRRMRDHLVTDEVETENGRTLETVTLATQTEG